MGDMEMLEELSQCWKVEIIFYNGLYMLTIRKRAGQEDGDDNLAMRTHRYLSTTLGNCIARAWAGEPGD